MIPVATRVRVEPNDRWDQHEIDHMIRSSTERDDRQIPERYRTKATVTVSDVQDWVDGLIVRAITESRSYPIVRHGPSLVLLGLTGRGKTHNSFGAVRELSASGVRFSWRAVSASRLFDELAPRHGVDSEEVFDSYSGTGVLILDDIGAHKMSEWREEKLTRLIDERYMQELPTIYVSNLPPDSVVDPKTGSRIVGFDEVVGDRVASRLFECAREVVVVGPDRRRSSGGAQ